MHRRDFIKTGLAGVTLTATSGWLNAAEDVSPPRPPARKPSMIIILADDLGYGDLPCYYKTKIRAPNLDRMAKEGIRFTDFHATASVCSPTRSSILSGLYPFHTGIKKVLFPKDTCGLSTKIPTISSVLKKQGYATACIGKWHLGHLPEFLPMAHGFDTYFGIPYSNDMGLAPELPFASNMPDNRTPVAISSPLPPLMRQDKVIEWPTVQDTLTERYTTEALRFIAENKNRPFLIYLAHAMPHRPLHASERFKGKSASGIYGDAVEELDWSVGAVLDAIKRHRIAENTLVVFTSDNGATLKGDGCNGPLRGGKGEPYEGGHRVPCLFWWPDHVPAGATCSELASVMDFLPTLARFGGVPVPERLDGHDIRPLILNESKAKTPYKSFVASGTIRSGPWKLVKNELYHLGNDLGEQNNLAAQHREKISELQTLRTRITGEGTPVLGSG
jgi:arylsulfatase A-like enzyme